MNAAVVRSYDSPPTYASFPDPEPSDGEVIVHVSAAGLHPIVKGLAKGAHYGSSGELPFVPGVDGAGRLADGTRVYFLASRAPFGSMSERSLARSDVVIPLPGEIGDATAAGIGNPAMSSWVALTARARFVAGESVMILGATGSAGRLAVQICKRLGARRVVAVGRDPSALGQVTGLGADSIIPLQQSPQDLEAAYRGELDDHGVDIVLDYLWGQPAELLLGSILQKGLHRAAPRIRYVEIGGSAGPTVNLPCAVLRSSGLELLGSGFGSASPAQILQALREFFESAGKLPYQFEIRAAPLRDVETIWDAPTEERTVLAI